MTSRRNLQIQCAFLINALDRNISYFANYLLSGEDIAPENESQLNSLAKIFATQTILGASVYSELFPDDHIGIEALFQLPEIKEVTFSELLENCMRNGSFLVLE